MGPGSPLQRPARPSSQERPVGTIELIDTPARLERAVRGFAPGPLGADVERADSDRYHRKAALIQIGDRSRCLLIDSMTLDDLAPVNRLLRDRLVILHAIENDIMPMESEGLTPPAVADTAIAAVLLGLPAGLGPLLSEVLDIELTADKERFQRADWEARPLTPGMLEYAADDVFHLPQLWNELDEKLVQAGRREWYEQELDAVLEKARTDDRSWTKVKGQGRLQPEQRAVLKELWDTREALAREHDIAPNRLLRDQVLVNLAEDPPSSPGDIIRRQQRRSSPVKHHAGELYDAVRRGLEAEPVTKDRGGRRPGDASREAFDLMRKARSRVAKAVGIDAGVLCSSRLLQPAANGEPESREELVALAGLRPWQADVLGDALWDAWTTAVANVAAKNGVGVDLPADDTDVAADVTPTD